jgi:hypothetical protein
MPLLHNTTGSLGPTICTAVIGIRYNGLISRNSVLVRLRRGCECTVIAIERRHRSQRRGRAARLRAGPLPQRRAGRLRQGSSLPCGSPGHLRRRRRSVDAGKAIAFVDRPRRGVPSPAARPAGQQRGSEQSVRQPRFSRSDERRYDEKEQHGVHGEPTQWSSVGRTPRFDGGRGLASHVQAP